MCDQVEGGGTWLQKQAQHAPHSSLLDRFLLEACGPAYLAHPRSMSLESLHLYRLFLRHTRQISATPVQRKLRYNARQIWAFYSDVRDPETLSTLHEEAKAAVRVLRFLEALPQVRGGGPRAWRDGVWGTITAIPSVLLAPGAKLLPPRHPPPPAAPVG